MSIQLVTYANQTVTPTNDAIIYERAIDQNGIFYGCNVTVSGNEVHITGGYGIVCGREFTIQSEAIAVTLAPSGTLDGRLYVRLDLADADAPIQLLTATGNTLPPLEQDSNVNYTNGTYEMELATFTVGVSALSDAVETYKTIIGTTPTDVTADAIDSYWNNFVDNGIKIIKNGNSITMCGSVIGGDGADGNALFRLSEEYRPVNAGMIGMLQIYNPAICDGYCFVRTDGFIISHHNNSAAATNMTIAVMATWII